MSEDDKKRDRALQRRVRERQAKTGESYQAAWRQLTGSEAPPEDEIKGDTLVVIAVPSLAPVDAESAATLQAKWQTLIHSSVPAGPSVEDAPPKSIATPRLVLPLHLPQVLPHQPTRVTARAKKGAVNIARIFISNAGTEGGAGDWIVNDIEVDGRSQLTLKNLSGALFGSHGVAANPKATTAFSIKGFDPVEHDRELTLIVTYVGPNPEGIPFFASAIGTSPPQRPTVVPIATRAPLGVLERTTISALIQNAPFQLDRLEIDDGGTGGGSADWIIHDLRVDGRTQFVQSGDIPGDMFSSKAIDTFVSIENCPAGSAIEIDVSYVGVNENGCPFVARLEGTVTRPDYTVPPPDLHVLVRVSRPELPKDSTHAVRDFVDAIAERKGTIVLATCNWRFPPPAIDDRTS